MAATVLWQRYTGATPTAGSGTTIADAGTTRFSLSDSASPGTSNPLVIPPSGSNRSWWMNEGLYVSVAPSGSITNTLAWFTSAWASGVTEDGGFATFANYVQASTLDASNGKQLNTTNYANLTSDGSTAGVVTDIANQTSGWRAAAKKTWPQTSATFTGTGSLTHLLVTQLVVASTATQGTVSNTMNASYDET